MIGKPNANIPVIMPARVAAADIGKPVTETIGSGPFIFRKSEWRPGDRAIFHRNPAYQPRPEPADGMTGGKVAHFDVVEFVSLPDPATKVAALQKGKAHPAFRGDGRRDCDCGLFRLLRG